jgi:type I restriction enzyme, S subunit
MLPDRRIFKLRQLIAIRHGFAFASEHYAEIGPYVLLTPGNFREEGGFRWLGEKQKYYQGPVPNGFVLNPGSMLIAMTEQAPGLLGSSLFVPNDYVYLHNQRLGAVDLLAVSDLDLEYLHYLLSSTSMRREIYAGAGGTKVRHTSPEKLLSLEVALPQLLLQRRVVEILRTWDDAVEEAERLIVAKELQFSWFRAELLTGKRRLAGHSSNWRSVRLNEVLVEHASKSSGAEEVHSVSVHKGLVNQVEHLGRSFAAKETGHYKRVKPGDIVYTKSPTGDFPLGIVKQSRVDKDVIVSPLYGVFTPVTPHLGTMLDAFFETPVNARNYLAPLVQKGPKNTIAITNKRFLEGKLTVPLDAAEQTALADLINTTRSEIRLLRKQTAAFARQKRGLMQKLLTGEWHVPMRDGEVDAVAVRAPEEAAE